MRKCEGNRSISFFFKSITFEFARGRQSTSVQIAVASLQPLRNSSQFFQRLMDEKKKKKKREKNPDYFWFHPLFLIYVLRIEGKPEFHFHDSIPQPMLHVDEILTLLFFSRKRSFNTPVEFSISVPQEQ